MSNFWEEISNGILGEVFGSAVLVLLGFIFYKYIMPFIESKTYKGIKIDGHWQYEIKYPSGNESVFVADIGQVADKVKCKVTETKTLVGKAEKESRFFDYEGTFVDRILTLTGRNRNKRSLGVYSFLLELKGDGDELTGVVSRYCLTDHVIKSDAIKWKRINKNR